jgi:hypothetical protein
LIKIDFGRRLYNKRSNTTGRTATGDASLGKDNKLSLKNSGTLAASIKVPTPEGISAKVGVSVNLYNAGKGVVKMIEGGVSCNYVSLYLIMCIKNNLLFFNNGNTYITIQLKKVSFLDRKIINIAVPQIMLVRKVY